jgi:oxygen-independent coproporphyrinogen-3 oxidase
MPPSPPRSAYIHVPFCRRRCGYCNFTLVADRDDLVGAYLDALECELRLLDCPREVDTLFLGGGTPTHIGLLSVERLLKTVVEWHPLPRGHEFTIETNPEDLTSEIVGLMKEYGVTRVSIGAQSFAFEKLRKLERLHSAEDTRRSVALAKQAGMATSIDLIFAAPGETLLDWERDLQRGISLGPSHISTYGLTFEKGAQFWNRRLHGELRPASEELERSMFEAAIGVLCRSGFEHYEVSNFARPNHRCRHNEVYWLGKEYYAAGPGAARYINGVRSMNHRSTTTYIKRVLAGTSPVCESERLTPAERALELLVFALRRCDGVERCWFQEQTGLNVDTVLGEMLGEFAAAGLLCVQNGRIALTSAGFMVSDSVFSRILTRSPLAVRHSA